MPKSDENNTKPNPKLKLNPRPIILIKTVPFQGKYSKNHKKITSHAFKLNIYTFYARFYNLKDSYHLPHKKLPL